MNTTRSARTFLERYGLRPTRRNPLPRQSPGTMVIHRLPVGYPPPRPDLMTQSPGQATSSGRTDTWPPSQEVGNEFG